MSALLDEEAIAKHLEDLPGWAGDTSALKRSVTAPSFLEGIQLIDAVAAVAEALDHHPDMDIRWRTITFVVSTHSEGGVTGRDVELAGRINDLAEAHGAS